MKTLHNMDAGNRTARFEARLDARNSQLNCLLWILCVLNATGLVGVIV